MIYSWPCLTDTEADLVLPKIEPIIDGISSAISPGDSGLPDETTLVQRSCRRRVYQRKGNEFAIIKSWRQLSVSSIPRGPTRTPEESAKCLNQAVGDVSQIDFADGETIVKTYRGRLPKRWNDLDAGPVTGLDCSQGKGPAYYVSIDTFLHEMTHSLQSKDCLFVPNVTDNTCFDFKDRNSMPRANVVTLTDFPTKDQGELGGLTAIQKVYQYAWAQSTDFPLGVFDELNAYTISTETTTAELRAIGVPALYDESKHRDLVNLPLFMTYAVKYLIAVKEANPKLYKEEFAEGTKNRQVIDLLPGRAEKAYSAWTDELKRVGMPEMEAEKNLWQQYLAMKPMIAS